MAGYRVKTLSPPVRKSGLHLEREVRAGKPCVDVRLIDMIGIGREKPRLKPALQMA